MRLQRALMLLVVIAIAAACSKSGASSLAELAPQRERVSVRTGDGDEFDEGSEGQGLEEGDVVRTDETGRTEILYGDGSLTRLDVETTFEIVKLVAEDRGRETATRLDSGNTWHRVKKLSESDSFSVSTASATAAVRGTAFVVRCDEDGTCTFTVIEGVVEITLEDGTVITLRAGQSVTVDADGEAGEVVTLSPDQLASDPWISANLELDEEAGLIDEDDASGGIGGGEGGSAAPSEAELDRSRLVGTYDVVLTATSAEGFRNLAAGDERRREYDIEVDCDGGTCDLTLVRATADGVRRTPLTYDDGAYRATDEAFARQDCLLEDDSVEVAQGVSTSVEVVLEATGARVVDGAWEANRIGGTVTETAERTGDSQCVTGRAVFDLDGRKAG